MNNDDERDYDEEPVTEDSPYYEYDSSLGLRGDPLPRTSNQIAFQFPNLDIAPDITSVAREAARVLRVSGVTGPFTVTVTVEGHYPGCKDRKETR